jgi:hypothetical protein
MMRRVMFLHLPTAHGVVTLTLDAEEHVSRLGAMRCVARYLQRALEDLRSEETLALARAPAAVARTAEEQQDAQRA